MAPSGNRPTWRRIYRQTLTLIYKNLLVFYKTPIATLIRALVFPVVFTIIMCKLQNVADFSGSSPYYAPPSGSIASQPTPIQDLDVALKAGRSQRLVFVRNGIPGTSLDPIIDGVLKQPGMIGLDTHVTDDPNDLWDLCKQSLHGQGYCFAAVIFLSLNETDVVYSIALDDQVRGMSANSNEPSLLSARLLPLQWAIDASMGGLAATSKPSEQAWSGSFYDYRSVTEIEEPSKTGPDWLAVIGAFVAPIFILIVIGVVYHLSIFVARERETQVSELMQAQMVTEVPRILSTLFSFMIVYFPGFIICSVLLTQLLFTKTSDILFLFMMLLAGTSMIVSTHFLASFFGKAQLAGLYTSTLAFALSLISLTILLGPSSPFMIVANQRVPPAVSNTQTLAMSLVFPPYAFATLIGDVANREFQLHAFSLRAAAGISQADVSAGVIPQQALAGYLYVLFFLIQILVFGFGTYGVEKILWGVKRDFEPIDASSDVALRFTKLSKTYHSKRPWYWPFKTTTHKLAVEELDLEVKKGSVTFLLGPNGGGKTTTLKCAAGIHSMDKGSRLEINEAGVVFGICPQHNVFWENLTVKEHINIWRSLKTAAFDDLTNDDDDDDVISECDLIEKSNAAAKTLSGGQMRKLQLAISFVGGSKVCCIDEASSGLDPLSRRNIWNIIQKGHTRRTILVTTHFLDEADVLADHIAIMYKGKLVCEGPGTSLKARFGGSYVVEETTIDGGDMSWKTSNSAEATRKILELEASSDENTYNVVFPTLEQVFLKVTSGSDTAINKDSGDGIIGDGQITSEVEERDDSLNTGNAKDIDLDVGQGLGIARQVQTLFGKRYTLLLQKSGWISYGINLIIPILIAAVLVGYFPKLRDLRTCKGNVEELRARGALDSSSSSYYSGPVAIKFDTLENSYYSPSLYAGASGTPAALVGPISEFSGPKQDDIFTSVVAPKISNYNDYGSSGNSNSTDDKLYARKIVNDIPSMIATISNSTSGGGFNGIAIFAPSPASTILFHDSNSYDAENHMIGLSLITYRLANASKATGIARKSSVNIRTFRHIESDVNFFSMPIALLLGLAFITAASIAVIYPTFEKINRVRALHYCNGVSPFALWLGYLLFDIQIIIIQSIIVWALLFAGKMTRLYYGSTYILGVFILFGIATYLGTYLLSLFIKRAAFAIAAGLHILLLIIYFVSYIGINASGNYWEEQYMYSMVQYFLGLTSPGANLLRALFVSMNVLDVLCGKFGDAELPAMSYVRYGSVYANLIIQIIFLIAMITVYEYGSADKLRRMARSIRKRGLRNVDDGTATYIVDSPIEKTGAPAASTKILSVSNVTKLFGRNYATQNISFDVSSNETLALLGGNGAGKTTMINQIRGELKPDFGEIYLDGVSVLRNPRKTRSYMGVCPQDDAVDNLTVRQTLKFYAKVKGLKNVDGNVDRVMAALNITMYEENLVKALSGGTKRKLSVAIALLGNPRILLLDEPSTGQDAGAKRILWKALQDISANRAILLTTHSMEEAEALATNVAIMGTKMLATGTLSKLQETYGGLYSVRAVRLPTASAEKVKAMVEASFPHKVSQYEDSHGQVSFSLPHDKRAFGAILRILEGLKGDVIVDEHTLDEGDDEVVSSRNSHEEGVLEDYTINGPTLEEVFMNVARETGIAGGV